MAIRLSDDGDDVIETHDINVTPFIDVMLVLLIIFMVAAPLSTVDLPVDLPTSNAQPIPKPDEPIYLTVSHDLTLHVGEQPVTAETLKPALDAAAHDDTGTRIFLRADRLVNYGDLMRVLNAVRAAGYRQVALVGLEADAAN